jgi:hypothetical protein
MCWQDTVGARSPPAPGVAAAPVDALFEIERAINGKSPEERLAVR